ncbi:MAG: TrmB family transcriptional regulator [Candidatus Melainabacteria bacterium]|nr:TrmB family transcriptional regulator [Candidatus Melainabacteria bacterium]
MDSIIDRLKNLGFNTYEAKVYLALLRQHPATGYEISKESGVPQARAYDTLKALEANQSVISIGGKPTKYMPINPNELLDRWENSFKESVTFLRDTLPNLSNETIDPIVNLRGEEAIFKNARELIYRAKKSVYIELWQDDAHKLYEALKDASDRGVMVRVVGYKELQLDFADVFQHGMGDRIEQTLGGRWMIMAVDDEEGHVALVTLNNAMPTGVYTRNAGLIMVIKMLIVHDMFLLDVESSLRPEMERVYGKTLLKLREKILGSEQTVGFH